MGDESDAMQDRSDEGQEFDEAIEEEQQIADENLVEAIPSTGLIESGPARLLEIAVQQDLDIDKLERLMAMQERWNEQQAKKAYYKALTRFQQLVPILIKDKKVDFTTKAKIRVQYSHATLGKINSQIRDPAANCGLSYRWEFKDEPELMEVTCIITHIDGHSEQSSMSAPEDTSGVKNTIQGRQSTRTYLERSTLIGALGLMSADTDDDGRQGQVSGPTPEEALSGQPDLPKGTNTKAPKGGATGKTDFEKQTQLWGLLQQICGTDDPGALSDELILLTKFEQEGEETKSESSLKNLKGKWLNTALGKAKAKVKKVTDELDDLLKCPALTKEFTDGIAELLKSPQSLDWYRDQIVIVKEMIADKEKA